MYTNWQPTNVYNSFFLYVSDTLTKVLTFQKAMLACECSPQEMSRGVRILNELARSQSPTPLVCRMIQVGAKKTFEKIREKNVRKINLQD
jgi:hypothetical protein